MILQNYKNCLQPKFDESEVLIFQRNSKLTFDILKKFVRDTYQIEGDVKTISEYKGSDYYVDLLRYDLVDFTTDDYKIFDLLDLNPIIIRDRTLREMGYNKAKLLIYKAAKFFIEFFSQGKFKLVCTWPVDNYVMDVMCCIGNFYGIYFAGIVRFFYKGYLRPTIYGEFNDVRIPEQAEVLELYSKLVAKEKSIYVLNKADQFKAGIKYYFKYKLKYLYHYLYKFKFSGLLNYDYISTPYPPYPRGLKYFNTSFFLKNLDLIHSDPEKTVYVPLHYFPESTLEYWQFDYKNSDYIYSLLKVLLILKEKGYTILLKEHTSMLFRRNPEFYKMIIDSGADCKIIDPFVSTFDVFQKVDTVVVWTGTTGIEAIINDKVVYFVSDNYYKNEICCDFKDFGSGRPFTYNEKINLLSRLLQNTIVFKES